VNVFSRPTLYGPEGVPLADPKPACPEPRWNYKDAVDANGEPGIIACLPKYIPGTCKVSEEQDCMFQRMGGCFAPETKILMGDGSLRRADQIREGDEIWNPARRKAVRVRMPHAGPETVPMLAIDLGTTILRVTQGHAMITERPSAPVKTISLMRRENGGSSFTVKPASALTVGENVLLPDGSVAAVRAIRSFFLDSKLWVYNFEADTDSKAMEDHLIVADGAVTGDLFLQRAITGE
jgi:hypothetical protein